MLSECCKAEILFDAWVTWEGEVHSIFDYCVCSKCGQEKPPAYDQKKELLNDN